MGEHLIKPYEISVWEEKLIQDGAEYRFTETKLAVIGSDTMTGLNKVYDPVFNKKSNGEKTLTFFLKYRYFDPYIEEQVENPFTAFLINERKIKLYYDDQWYEFIIKDHTESSEELTWIYTCTDAFVLELSKQGYNITFDSELNNNQGTAEYLVNETLKDTDWKLGGVNVGRQLIAEPIYRATIINPFEALNTDTNEIENFLPNEEIFVFYSYIKNQDGKFLQFIKRSQNDLYTIDDKNVITATNYRILENVQFDDTAIEIITENQGYVQTIDIITIGQPETLYQANRLAYGQLTTYDHVMERTVNRLQAGDREIYKYTDYVYTTSNIIRNFITNGDNFNALEDGSLQGWNPYVDSTDKIRKLELVTKPELGTDKPLADINVLSQIEGFLKVRFNGAKQEIQDQSGQSYIYNTVYNSGIEDSRSFIESISNGQRFVFRWRAGERDSEHLQSTDSDLTKLKPNTSLRMLVAKYQQDTPTWGYYYKHIKPEDIILNFTGQITDNNILNNYITGGHLETITENNITRSNYIIDSVIQTPSTKYIYVDSNGQEYIWNGETGDFELKTSNNYLPYYYLTAEATQAVSNKELNDVNSKYGIFIYTIDNELTEDVIIDKSFVTNSLIEQDESEEIVNDDYPKYITVNIEPKINTTIEVSYISADSSSSHNFTFVAGTDDKSSNICQYNTSNNTILFSNTNGIVSYHITYSAIKPIYIQDIQLTNFIEDTLTHKPIIIGNIPVASSNATDYYYLKPEEGTAAEDVKTYTLLSSLASDLNIEIDNIVPLYNEGSEKYLTISAAQSNCFNILQNIAETFECWIDLVVEHDHQGYITLTNGYPNKYVYLREYAGKDNWAGFKYGVNLQSIERNVNSDEIVTKLIVDQSQSDLVDEGYISIANASSNLSGESYILNFDYYYKQGLLDRETTEADKFNFISQIAVKNAYIKELEKQRRDLELSMLHLDSKRTDYTLLIESAQNQKTEALADFEELTGKTYDQYKEEHQRILDKVTTTESYTAIDPDGIDNEFILINFPAINTNFTVNVDSWELTADFVGGNSDVVLGDSTLISTEVDSTVASNTSKEILFADIPDDTLITINTYAYADVSNTEDIQITIGIDSNDSTELFTYIYDGANNILTIAANEDFIITNYTYEIIDYIVSYDGLKTIKILGKPLGLNTIEVEYIASSSNQLTNEETILDLLARLYINSAIINNYSGILTNVEQEYWEIRKTLKGSETYTIKVWVGWDINDNRHVYIESNDYIQGVDFTLGTQSEQFSLSKKYFDIISDINSITFNISDQHHYFEGDNYPTTKTYTITDSWFKIKILSDESIHGVEDQITDLLEEKNFLTKQFNKKYSRYIQEGTWNSTDYIDAEHYYFDALQVSNTSAQPIVSYTINVVEISQLEGFEWYLFDAGDKSYVEDTEFFGWQEVKNVRTPAREEVIVSEVEWHLEEPENNVITVQNYKTRFEDLFQRISATVQTVQYNEATYTKTSTLLDTTNTLNENLLIDSLNNISGKRYNLTSNGSVVIDGDQILVQNLNNLANRVIINSEGIQVSSDGGKSWKTVLSGRGINLGAVYMGSLDTDSIIIGGEQNPSFRWDKSGISAYRSNQDDIYDLHTYVRYDQYGLYGIKNDTFKAQSLQDVKDKAYFAVTWDGFFIKNSYEGGGQVSITSDNDFQILKSGGEEKIKIGALEWNSWAGGKTTDPNLGIGAPTLYGIRIKNDAGQEVFKTTDEGNIEITGIINAWGGNFVDIVTVGKNSSNLETPYIEINGYNATIKSSDYSPGAGQGWLIDANGDAVFNNITARGAIKTAVFEYAEIQAVGGLFIFRPSSTIKAASVNDNDLILTLEKPYLFKVGDWCKVSNYTSGNEPKAIDILQSNGLTYVYKIIDASEDKKIVRLENAAEMVDGGNASITTVAELIGGALIDMGDKANGDGQLGNSNYGIGINSSDNVVNLPRRAISLFETIINEQQSPKVSYKYRGILGTLPELPAASVRQSIYPRYMQNTQGIYTDNMYIGDGDQYIAFYSDTDDLDSNNQPKKKLRISAREIIFGYNPNTQEEITWDDHFAEQVPVRVDITSNIGNEFIKTGEVATLTCRVYKGTTDITNQITRFVWTKKLADGTLDTTWNTAHANINSNTITVLPSDIDVKAIFGCDVTF